MILTVSRRGSPPSYTELSLLLLLAMNDELCMFVSLYVSLRTVISLLLFGHAPKFYCDALIRRIDI